MIDFGSCAPGSIPAGGDRREGMRIFTGYYFTPVDERTCVDRKFDEQVRDSLRLAIEEDKEVLMEIQFEEDAPPEFEPSRLRIDAASLTCGALSMPIKPNYPALRGLALLGIQSKIGSFSRKLSSPSMSSCPVDFPSSFFL